MKFDVVEDQLPQRIDWLLKADAPQALQSGDGVFVIPMPEDLGTGKVEVQALPLGMSVYFLDYQFAPSVTGQWFETAKMQTALDEPTLTIQSIQRGQGLMQDQIGHSTHRYGQGVALVSLRDQVDARYQAEAGPQLEGVTLEMTISRLNRLLGEDSVAALLKGLQLAEGNGLVPMRDPLMHKHLAMCAATPLTGAMRKLFLQSQVLNLLIDLSASTQARPSPVDKRARLIRDIRHEVDQSPGSPPDLDELARRYKVSARTINEGFKQAYGLSLIAYCAQQRLAAAHQALLETDVAMKVLAERLGYSHVNSFIAAFTKFFGVTPGSLRRR